MDDDNKLVSHLVVDTTAFIQNAPLQSFAKSLYTVQEVVDEIVNKRQLRRLCVLPYDLTVKDVFIENVHAVTEFAKKTGDYPSLSATDLKVMALTYQLEKEHIGTNHLRSMPVVPRTVRCVKAKSTNTKIPGFYKPQENWNLDEPENAHMNDIDSSKTDKNNEEEKSEDQLKQANEDQEEVEDNDSDSSPEDQNVEYLDDDDADSWITPQNIAVAKNQVDSELMEEKQVEVACLTTDFAMQNVLKQMNLNVAALDGRMIRKLRTFILRCYACFRTTSIMSKQFCPKCGNNTLKKVAVSLDEDGKQRIHINIRRPLTGRGKRFSLPTIKGGKHSNFPQLCEDQPMPQQRPSRIATTKNNPLSEDYIGGYSPFVMRDVTSRSAQLGIRPGDVKHWMRSNPNEVRRRRK